MNICVLIPVYNEAKAIGRVVKSITSLGLDVVVVDDGSDDDSESIAKKEGATVLRHGQKNGKGFSLQYGFNYIQNKGYDAVITMDGDGQHAATDLKAFIEKSQKYPHSVINGNRMTSSKGMPLVRYLTNKFMSFIISLATGQSIPDSQCGFRYIGMKVLKDINPSCTGFEIETEILMKAAKRKHNIFSVPIQTIYEDEESKINPMGDTIRFFSYFFKELFTKK